jgi:hypothetical protein
VNGGRFIYSKNDEFSLNVVKKPSPFDTILFRKKLLGSPESGCSAAYKFNNLFDRGDKSIVYTVTNPQITNLCDDLLVRGLELRRESSFG